MAASYRLAHTEEDKSVIVQQQTRSRGSSLVDLCFHQKG